MESNGSARTPWFPANEERIPFFVPLAVLLVYLLWRGYNFGFSDQDEVIPFLAHLLNRDVLAQDWFVNYQANHFGPRSVFVWFCYPFAKLLGIYTTFLGLYLAAFLATAGALYTLARDLLRDRIAATASVLLVLVLTPKFTLGGNDLIAPILTPSVPAWSLALWGLAMYVKGRLNSSAVLAGLAACLQALIGLQMGLLIGMLLIWQRSRYAWRFALLFGLVSLPAVAPLIVQQLGQAGDSGNLFYTLFAFRAPHHYLPASFTKISVVGFALLLITGLAGMRRLRQALTPQGRQTIQRLLMVIGAACLVGFLCAEVVPMESVVKLQPFKMTVVAKVLFGILVCGAISAVLPESFRTAAFWVLKHSRATFLAAALVLAALLFADTTALGLRPAEIAPVEEWANTSTPPEAVFAVPPSWDGFRSRAQRPIVVNYKAFPFLPGHEAEWLERLRSIAPITLPERGYAGILDSLDHAFFALGTQGLFNLSYRYGATHFVRDKPTHAAPLVLDFAGDGWWVYQIFPDALP